MSRNVPGDSSVSVMSTIRSRCANASQWRRGGARRTRTHLERVLEQHQGVWMVVGPRRRSRSVGVLKRRSGESR